MTHIEVEVIHSIQSYYLNLNEFLVSKFKYNYKEMKRTGMSCHLRLTGITGSSSFS
jgi:hypothetical protein